MSSPVAGTISASAPSAIAATADAADQPKGTFAPERSALVRGIMGGTDHRRFGAGGLSHLWEILNIKTNAGSR